MGLGNTPDLPQGAFSAYRKADLGGHIFRIPDFEPPQDRPRGGAKRQTLFWHHLQTDLGGVQREIHRLDTAGHTFGGSAKCRHSISHHLRTDLGGNIFLIQDFCTPPDGPRGVQKPLGRLATPPDRPRGTVLGFSHFCTPPDPLPDFPVHRGHRISTYRLPLDNSLSFPCLDGQC